MGDFLMPSLGADMEHGKIVEWLVKPGDYVRRGDLVAVVDTDKTVMDVESFQEGVVADLLVDIGETVPVGTPLARITQTPAEVGAPSREAPPPRPVAAKPESARPSLPRQAPPIAPPVRHLAHRLGVDTGRIHGTGKDGADHPGRRGARGGRPAGGRRAGAVLAAGQAARRRTRRRAVRRSGHRTGGRRDRGRRAARRGPPAGGRSPARRRPERPPRLRRRTGGEAAAAEPATRFRRAEKPVGGAASGWPRCAGPSGR